jgi:hypothetical protein
MIRLLYFDCDFNRFKAIFVCLFAIFNFKTPQASNRISSHRSYLNIKPLSKGGIVEVELAVERRQAGSCGRECTSSHGK